MNISELELKMMGKEAGRKYLENKVPMNTTIAKTAVERGMNPHQVARVCETANVSVYDELWNKTGSGNFTFDLADQDKIAESINSKSDGPPLDLDPSEEEIRRLLPKEEVEKEDTEEKQAGFDKIAEQIEENMPKERATALQCRKLLSKLSYYLGEINAAIFEAELTKKEAEVALRNTIKVAALRGENIAQAYAAALMAFPEKKAAVTELFADTMRSLEKHGISFKKHAEMYTEDATGQSTKGMLNKKHPILKHIDTIVNVDDGIIIPCTRAKDYVVKKVEVLRQTLSNHKFDNPKIPGVI